jgi:uncharacterized protein (DUF2384 family)
MSKALLDRNNYLRNDKDELIKELAELLGGKERLTVWLNVPHPVLDGRTPQSYLDEGKSEVLEYFIYAIETGQQTSCKSFL